MIKKISYREFLNKEYGNRHAPYQPEMDFYDAISHGNVDKVKEDCQRERFVDKEGLGTLSHNPLQNMKYHFTISAASIARACIRNGLPLAESYSLSDYFIQHADICKAASELSELHDEMAITYAKRMQSLTKKDILSRAVSLAIDYIYDNLNTRITAERLAEEVGLSQSYFSRLFKAETGFGIGEYILNKKLETAKSMLSFSSYSIAEISASLAFPSQSYFTNAMKKDCGKTPRQYRNESDRLTSI